MKINKLYVNLLFLVALVFVLSFSVSANLITPATSGVVSGTYTLNATNSSLDEMLNCTFYASSASTANSSAVSVGTATNESASDVALNVTFVSTILEDANDYVFYASCWNATTQANTSTSTAVVVDNTIPQAPSSLSPGDASIDTDGSVTFSGTVTGVNTTSCTLNFAGISPGSGGTSRAMTHTGDTCSLTLTSIPDQSYQWYITASDETNTTDSSTVTVTVDIQEGNNGGVVVEEDGDGKGSSTTTIIIILCVIVAIVVIIRKR